ncbi:DoxX family protein [Patulibacter sp. NPDC049589]|uniref:DoxX family protein n=1 Tax=Patulibacter sp. NPDC049589 TaxID=3154731 RepID=UPI003427ABA7
MTTPLITEHPDTERPIRRVTDAAQERVHHAVTEPAGSPRRAPAERYAWALTRIGLGWLFFWAFIDKMFGLGHDTTSGQAWINGGNPTKGYLSSATGPLDGLFQGMAGGWLVNVLFMAGLLAVGAALMLGVAHRLATLGGVLLVALMWVSHLPPDSNPFLDDHLIYAAVLVGLLFAGADRTLGLGERWSKLGIVRRLPLLR